MTYFKIWHFWGFDCRFFGCVYLRKLIQDHIKSDPAVMGLQSPEPGVILFRVNDNNPQAQGSSGLTCRIVSYASNQHQSLHLKLEPDQTQGYNYWSQNPEMTSILERFFDSRVVSPPYRLNAITAFFKLMQSPTEALKDLINTLRYTLIFELIYPKILSQNFKN